MSTAGRPKVLDENSQAIVCNLVAAGVSIREAADFLDCDPRSIRREAERNENFGRQLAQAKSDARVHPLETLRRAAKSNWRAALCWAERMNPERFARPNASIITQREANKFADDLIEFIQRIVVNTSQRAALFKLLAAAMPAAMRCRWDSHQVRRNIKRAIDDCDLMKWEEDQRQRREKEEREKRRRKVFDELKRYLPDELRATLAVNFDLLDPEEVFAPGTPAPSSPTSATAQQQKCAPAVVSPTSDDPTNVMGSTGFPCEHAATNNASPTEDIVPAPGRNLDNNASSPLTNPEPANDLPPLGEA